MGKIKTKYPLELEVDFMMFLQTSELLRQSYTLTLTSGDLQYSHIHAAFTSFLELFNINYESYMFFQSVQSEKEEILTNNWSLSLKEIQEHNRYLIIKVKSHTTYIKDLLYQQLDEVISRLNKIEERIHSRQLPDYLESTIPNGSLILHQNSSLTPPFMADKDLDIGVLFSEPIFDGKRHRQANLPVDFRSQLQRLYSALNNSYKPEITFECQIATKEHLKHLIGYKKPKILHIICHGTKEGELEFEDDSKFLIGTLNSISTDKIRELLEDKKQNLPDLVFINSCHSEIIGRVFYEVGAKYCIMIDSQDKIDDEAAQIFSENFYRNIFRGEKVGIAFKEAQDNVKIKQNSSGCCCRHTSREKHKQNCRWLEICSQMGEVEAHRMYHIPSSKCTCELRNINQHDLICQWAQFSLFHINNDFRILDNGVYRFPKKKSQLPKYLPSQKKKQMLLICCCFNLDPNDQMRIPHSESNKFKMLPQSIQNTQPLYELQKNISFRTQIIDFSAPELIESHQKFSNTSVMGRQQELFQFMKGLKNNQFSVFFLYGHQGVGKTTFAIKSATYLIERRVFEIYFFIDLFDIKDRDMFRNKFNEVTQFGYPFNKNSIAEVKSKPMILILDNVDDFFINSINQFSQEIDGLRKQLPYCKFLLTCKDKNISVIESEPIFVESHTMNRELKVLDENTAAKVLFSKIRNYLDISISYFDIREIVASKQELRIPKVIENLSHSFSQTKDKIKLDALKQKVMQLGQGDFAFKKLIEENLNILKNRCKESYDMLIFISQFSQGIDKNDFNILGSYNKSDSREGFGNAMIDIPIGRNWKKNLNLLFENNLEVPSQVYKIQSETESDPSFQNRISTIDLTSSKDLQKYQQEHTEESFFLQEVSRNRFVVKRFIRDFIWNKDRSDENYYMKHIFVAYTAVMLDVYLNFLVSEKYIHEELLEYSDISQAGIFKYKDNNYVRGNLTDSIRYVEDYNTRFQKILKQQPTLRQKIRNSDPSVFIMNHKLDFLHIYAYDWSKIYEHLIENKSIEARVLINYLQRLIILIPTAMKIANLEESLIKYSIRQSIQLHSQIRKYSKPSQNLMLTLKLKLMKAGTQILKGEDNVISYTQFQKEFHKTDLQGIDGDLLQQLQKQFDAEIEVLSIYLQYVKTKQYLKGGQGSIKIGERMIETMRKLEEWNSNNFQQETQCQILVAKRKLILTMIYNKILENSIKNSSNIKFISLKNAATITSYVKNIYEAAKIFSMYRMTKLTLRSKMLAVTINWEQLKNKIKQNQFSREFERQRIMLRECEQLYEDKKNNLIGLTIFDSLLKKVKKEMKDKVWQESANNIVIMKAVPLSKEKNFILENIVRRKPKHRKDMETIFMDSDIDLSLKVQILTSQRLIEQSKRKSSILILSTNFRSKDNKVYLICEDINLREDYIEINSDFANQIPLSNTRLVIIIGANATQAFRQLTKLFPNGPSIFSITTRATDEFDDFEQVNYDDFLVNHSSKELRDAIEQSIKIQDNETQLGKTLIKALINPKNSKKGIKQIYSRIREESIAVFRDFKVEIRQSSKQIIKVSKGRFMDFSPGFKKAHNIDLEWRHIDVPCICRKWKQITQVFKEFNNTKRQTKYIQLCGASGVGKSTFIMQLGRICIERNLFQSGIYIIKGKAVEEHYQSDFELYISKMSENSTGMFNLQSFNKYADSNFLLIIDDFHLIKPRSNGRYNLFLNKIISKKVNVIFVTHQSTKVREQLSDLPIRVIKIGGLTDVELNIFAYNIFDNQNIGAIEEYEDERKKSKLTVPDIRRIYNKHSSKYNNYLRIDENSMRKLTSNRN